MSNAPPADGAREAPIVTPPPEVTADSSRKIPRVALNASEIVRGAAVEIRGSDVKPNTPLVLIVEEPNSTVTRRHLTSSADGTFTASYRTSPDNTLGIYLVRVENDARSITSDTVRFKVTEPSREYDNAALPLPKSAANSQTPQPTGAGAATANSQSQTAQVPERRAPAWCHPAIAGAPTREGVILNEIAWMGTEASSADEWIELKNISAEPADISGWQLLDEKGDVKIKFDNGTRIESGAFFLLERTDDGTVPNVSANLIYRGALSNEREIVRLWNGRCAVIDEAKADPTWPSGDAASKKTMERDRIGPGWHTSSLEGGTPKQENSVPVQPAASASEQSSGGGEQNNQQAANSQSSSSTSQSQSQNQSSFAISEIMYDLPGSDEGREWIEVRNTGAQDADLTEFRLLENGTRHVIKAAPESKQTTNLVRAGEYAVIADDPAKFMGDNAAYAGALFTASFSLGNGGETLALTLGNDVKHSVAYTASAARGDGTSLQLVNNSWIAAPPTPGTENKEQSAASSSSDAAPVLQIPRVVMSEIFPDPEGSDDGREFVEIHNLSASAVDISGWSLQYRSSGDSFDAVKKKNFEAGNTIAPKGFFLVGTHCSSESPCSTADMSWSQALGNSGGDLYLVNHRDAIAGADESGIADVVSYGALGSGVSLERRATGSGCVAAQGAGEFLGNGCDTGGEADFEIRAAPRPQRMGSLPEPRDAPVLFNSDEWRLEYDPSSFSVRSSWPKTPGLLYEWRNVTEENSLVYSGDADAHVGRIRTVGTTLTFSMRALDADGLASGAIEKELAIPSPLRDVAWFSARRRTMENLTAEEAIIEFAYDAYPFLPRDLALALAYGEPPAPNYKTMVWYLNRAPPADEFLDLAEPRAERAADAHRIARKMCSGSYAARSSLILPDAASNCAVGVNDFSGKALDYATYVGEGDKRVALAVAAPDGRTQFTEADYFTVGYYGFYRTYPQGSDAETASRIFKLLAVDGTRRHFQVASPSRLPPVTPSNLRFSHDAVQGKLDVAWDASTDPDTPDALIRYEISYDGGASWREEVSGAAASVTAGKTYDVRVRAFDEFEMRSAALAASYAVPLPPPPADSSKDVFENNPKPNGYIGQRLGTGLTGSLKKITLHLRQSGWSYNNQIVNLYSGTSLAASFKRKFAASEAGVEGEYIFASEAAYALDPEKDYVFIASFPDIAPVVFWGSSDPDTHAGAPIRDFSGTWQEKSGTIKDLYFALGFE
ncbi:MAG: lamin tail domain-containing protein [Candidatus Colwellbacteria bacterium]|nr:lamin tail domain-containing protein [Candidatus Colwellbacteria bacterium]